MLARVPKGARVAVADALATLIEDVNTSNNIMSWARLFGFAYSALKCPPKTSQNDPNHTSLTTKIRSQTNTYMLTPVLPATSDGNSNRAGGTKGTLDSDLGRRVASKLADFDIRGAVRIISSDDGFAGYGEEVTSALQAKHPPAPTNVALPPAPDETTPPFQATKEQVIEGLQSFPVSSSSGPDGLRPGHLLSLTSRGAGAAGERLKGALVTLVNLVISGQVPDSVRPLLFGAALCALAKKGGGIRPIAVGNTLRRLTTKIVLKRATPEIRDQLEPTQLGVGTPAGCEAALRATRHYIEATQTPKVLLKIDLTNAFNSIRRDRILEAVRELTPDAYHLFHQAYGYQSLLFHGEKIILSDTGLQQGDPAGPALFSLTVDSLVKSLTSELNVWYLDDGTVGDTVDNVIRDLDRLLIGIPELGGEINGDKCEVIPLCHTDEQLLQTERLFRSRLPTIKITPPEHQNLLGSALTDEAVPVLLAEKLVELKRLTSRLEHIDSHPALVLLKNCFSLPKLTYILRTSTAFKFPEQLKEIDDTIKCSLSTITNVDFTEESWCQARLPVRHGGLGIRTSKDIAPSAFLASHYATEGLVARILHPIFPDQQIDPQEALACWQGRVPNIAVPNELSSQKAWDELYCMKMKQDLLNEVDQIGRARLLAACAEGSGAWLHALPVPALGTLMDNDCVRIVVALRVGAIVCQPHKCRCGTIIDSLGHHPLSCRFSLGRHPRHAGLNDIIKRALNTAGLPSNLEPPGLDRGDGRRPDGMTVFPFKNGKPLLWDATCTDTFAATNIINCALHAGYAANHAEAAKTTKYQHLTDRYIFQPVAVETTGVLGMSTVTFLKELGRKMATETGDAREGAWLRQRLSIAVARGNALSVTASAKTP